MILVIFGKISCEKNLIEEFEKKYFNEDSLITESEAKEFSKQNLSFFPNEKTLFILLPTIDFSEDSKIQEYQRRRLLKVETILSKITGNQNILFDEDLSSIFRDKTYKKDQIITKENDEGNTIYFIQEGICYLTKELKDHNIEFPVYELSANAIIGEELFLENNSKYYFTTKVISLTANFICVKAKNLIKILSENEINEITKKLNFKLYQRNEKLKSVTTIKTAPNETFGTNIRHLSPRKKKTTLGKFINSIFNPNISSNNQLEKSFTNLDSSANKNPILITEGEINIVSPLKLGPREGLFKKNSFNRSKFISHRLTNNPFRPGADLLLNKNIDPILTKIKEKGKEQLEAYFHHLNHFSKLKTLSDFKNASQFDEYSELKQKYEKSIEFKRFQIERKRKEERKPTVRSLSRLNFQNDEDESQLNQKVLQNILDRAYNSPPKQKLRSVSEKNIHVLRKEMCKIDSLQSKNKLYKKINQNSNSNIYLNRILTKIRANSLKRK